MWELIALGTVAILGLIGALVMQARSAGKGKAAKAQEELDATIEAATRVKEARRLRRSRGRDLVEQLRRDAEERNGP